MKTKVMRFTPSERWFHNIVAVTFLILLLTGGGMLFHNYNGYQGASRQALAAAHKYTSVVFVVAPLLILALGDRRVWRENIRLLSSWGAKDIEWLLKKPAASVFGDINLPLADKFNPGQKTWATLAVCGSATLAMSGVVMWTTPSPILAIMAHAAVATVLAGALAGHVFMAVGNKETRESINSIIHGKVCAKWARHHHPLWMERQSRRFMRTGEIAVAIVEEQGNRRKPEYADYGVER